MAHALYSSDEEAAEIRKRRDNFVPPAPLEETVSLARHRDVTAQNFMNAFCSE